MIIVFVFVFKFSSLIYSSYYSHKLIQNFKIFIHTNYFLIIAT